jgi:hypothetical protein
MALAARDHVAVEQVAELQQSGPYAQSATIAPDFRLAIVPFKTGGLSDVHVETPGQGWAFLCADDGTVDRLSPSIRAWEPKFDLGTGA